MNNKFDKKKESYPPERTICDKTLDDEGLNAYMETGILKDILFKKCVFQIECPNIWFLKNCEFQECIFEDMSMRKLDVSDCVFIDCVFSGGSFSKVDVLNSFFSKCRYLDVTCVFVWFYDSYFKSCAYNLATFQSVANLETTAFFGCKFWKSDTWFDLPDSEKGDEFFELQQMIDE